MRKIRVALAILLMILSSRHLAAQAGVSSGDKQQIQAALALQLHTANAHDTDGFLATYWHNPDLVFAVFGDIYRGYDAVREVQLQVWQHGAAKVVYSGRGETEFRSLAPGLILTTQPMHSTRPGPDGKAVDGDFVITSIWKKLPEGWRVIYAHESWAR